MKGYYEKQWQEALDGARIQPSEALWGSIEKGLTNNNSNRTWMTILLIAATVTIAFAFPLTIGNSSFEARPDSYQYLSQANLNDTEIAVVEGINNESSGNPQNTSLNKVGAVTLASRSTQVSSSNLSDDGDVSYSLLAEGHPNVIIDVNTKKYDLTSIDMKIEEPGNELEQHYLIPYYIPVGSIERDMLASINMGTGSASAGSGFSGLGSFESADMMAAEPLDNISSTDTRSEFNGSTYYIGAGVELPVGNKWSLLTGLGYLTQTANGTSNIVLENGGSYQPVGAYDPILPGTVFLSEAYDYTVNNRYINIPLTLKYSLINKKFKLRAGFGLSSDFMLSHNLKSESYGSANYSPSSMDYKPIVLAGLINFDISYNLNNRYSVALETGVRKGFTPIDESKEYYPSSFTVGLILFYKFHR